jgi:hypothetical protein
MERSVADVLSAQGLRRKIPVSRLSVVVNILICGFKLNAQSQAVIDIQEYQF